MTISARLIAVAPAVADPAHRQEAEADGAAFGRELAMEEGLRRLTESAARSQLSSTDFIRRVMAALPSDPPPRPRSWWRRLLASWRRAR